MADFAHAFARRTRIRGGDELSVILAGSPPGVLSMTGGFPNPATFPELADLAAELLAGDTAVSLQYTPVAGIPSSRPIQVSAGVERTASTTRPSTAIPNTLNSARPPLPSMNGYTSTPASWTASSTADGSLPRIRSTPGR